MSVRRHLAPDGVLRVLRYGKRPSRLATVHDVELDLTLLQIIDLQEIHDHASPQLLGRLPAYDHSGHRSELVRTVTAYLECFGNTLEAAERMHVHPNTFRYRLRRLEEIGDVDLGDSDTWLALQLELRLQRLAAT